MMCMEQGENTASIDQRITTAIESIFGSSVNSKTEDTLLKILLRFSELDVKAHRRQPPY